MTTKGLEQAPEEGERKYRAPALEKGLDILELLAEIGEPLTTSQIAAKLGRSVSELFRMVLTLEARGYIAQIGGREGYGLTNKMFALGVAQTPTRTLIEVALPEMQELARKIGQSCHLVVASNDQIVVVARIESPMDLGFSVRVGYRRPLIESTSGIILCAVQEQEERERMLEELEAVSDAEIFAGFRSKVESSLNAGRVRSQSDFVKGVVDLASPVMGQKGAIASLTVPYVDCNPVTCNQDEAFDMLKLATEQISVALRTENT
jgi:Transcriptional regulator